jgi:hypothetical protein
MDHCNMKFLLDQCLTTIPQHQWANKLLGFDFKVEFKPGVANVVADAVSRQDAEEGNELMALSASSFQLFDDIHAEVAADPELQAMVAFGAHGDD